MDQYVLAAWTVLCFSDSFRGKLKISALFIVVFLRCVVLNKIRQPSAVNLRKLKGVRLSGVFRNQYSIQLMPLRSMHLNNV